MNSAERILASLGHREPDRLPLDFGGTFVSGMHVSCIAALRDWYGLEKRPVKVIDPGQMLGLIEEDLKVLLGVIRRASSVVARALDSRTTIGSAGAPTTA